MIYITQLIYIQEGQEAVFHQFEEAVIPMIAKYKGCLMLRIRPEEAQIIEAQTDVPYEVHLVSFPTEKDFTAFMQDEDRKDFLALKEQSVQSVLLIKGTIL